MKFIKLTRVAGGIVWINPSQIVFISSAIAFINNKHVEATEVGTTYITHLGYFVETPEEIFALIESVSK